MYKMKIKFKLFWMLVNVGTHGGLKRLYFYAFIEN